MLRKVSRSNMYKYILISISLLLVLAMVGCKDSEVVAKVNDKTITKEEFYNILVEQNGEQVLDLLIAEMIINLEAEKAGIEITDEEIQTEIESIQRGYGGEEAFNEAMVYYGYTMEDFKDSIRTNMNIKKILEPSIAIEDEELVEYFEANKHYMDEEEQVNARHILVEDEILANELLDKIKSGEDFAELAKEHSKDTLSAIQGGELGFFGRGKMVQEFEEASFALGINEVSDIISTDNGYHIIEVLEKKEAKEANFEENKDLIYNILLESKIPALYETWHEERLEEYKITKNL